jgi:2-polyprenyl-3-methyl-5-hydroxy-6-metoxy-1,4-benzoquinol methylase
MKYVVHDLAEDDFASFYNDPTYFDSEYAGGVDVSYSASKETMRQRNITMLSIIRRYRSRGVLLEIGSAGGHFLELARNEFGYQVQGVEVADSMAQEGRSRGINIVTGFIHELPQDWKKADIVYMGDVLEHIPFPRHFIESVRRQMQPKALLVLELPLTYNLTLSGIIIGMLHVLKGHIGYRYFLPAQHRHGLESKPPYHVLMFNRHSIQVFLQREGFSMRYLNIYEGKPKPKFKGTWYGRLKVVTSWLTWHLPQNMLGDRMIVIAEKNE